MAKQSASVSMAGGRGGRGRARWLASTIASIALGAGALLAGDCGGGGSAAVTPPITTPDAGAPVDGSAGGMDAAAPGRPQPAMPLFDDTVIHQITLTMAPEDWQSIIDDSRGDEWRHATIVYDGVTVEQVGVRPSGESSRFKGNVKMAVRVKFDAFPTTGPFGGVEEINIKGEFDDGSMMRERLALFVYRALGPTSAVAHGRMVVNGDLRGLFTIRQIWDAQSIQEHFTAPVGPLYRLRPPNGVDPYVFKGADSTLYVPMPWEPHINHAVRGDDVVGGALAALPAGAAGMEQVFDKDTLLSYLAASALVMNTDGFMGVYGYADHFQYFDPPTGRFFILPWDPDNTFSSQGEKPTRGIYDRFDGNSLAKVVHASADLRAQYQAKIAAAMAKVPVEAVQAEADRIYDQIHDTAFEDPVKLFTNGTVEWSHTYVKDFVAQRYAYLRQALGLPP
jgi:hypothetical protein